jgi:hypothetical protein
MTTCHSCICVGALCGLLTLATSAFAEGAWTLWMMGASSPWDSVGTFSTRELCMEAEHQQAQAVEKLGLKVTEDTAAGSFLATGADLTAGRMRAKMTNILVFHCPNVECRWGRGVEYTNETADESLEATAAMCALDRRLNCPLASSEQRAKLLEVPDPRGPNGK